MALSKTKDTFERALIDRFLPDKPEDGIDVDKIAHYTQVKTILDIVGKGGITSLWATGLRYLNDRQEMNHGTKVLQKVALTMQGIDSIVNTLDQLVDAPDVYQVSFSGAPDELGQWRGYGKDGQGCSIIVEKTSVASAASVSGWVIYEESAQEAFAKAIISEVSKLNLPLGDDLLSTYMVVAASFMKHPGFRPEREYRLLLLPGKNEQYKMRSSGDRLAPYVDVFKPENEDGQFDASVRLIPAPIILKEILVGPSWQLSEIEKEDFDRHHVPLGIARQLARHKIDNVDVNPSRIPYDPR